MTELVRPLLIQHIPVPDIINYIIFSFIPFDQKLNVIITIDRDPESKNHLTGDYWNIDNARKDWMKQNNFHFYSWTKELKEANENIHCIFNNVPYFKVISLKQWNDSDWGRLSDFPRPCLILRRGREYIEYPSLDSPEHSILYRPRSFTVCRAGWHDVYWKREKMRIMLLEHKRSIYSASKKGQKDIELLIEKQNKWDNEVALFTNPFFQ